MNRIILATKENIKDIVDLRYDMQLECWKNEINKDFKSCKKEFKAATKTYLEEHLNKSLMFAIYYIDDVPVAICGVEVSRKLPQITLFNQKNGMHCDVVSAYTKPEYREKGYQRNLMIKLLQYVKEKGVTEISCITCSPQAGHIYENMGILLISHKYFMQFEQDENDN